MKTNGYYGIGIEQGKTESNYWTLFRTAQILDADFLFTIGKRYKYKSPDTAKSYRHIPIYNYTDFEDFNSHRPYDCPLVGIELTDSAYEVSTFIHPKRAIYLLGAEDHGLTNKAIENCQSIIKLYGERSMNVAVAGSIVLYDRFSKERRK